MSKTGQRLLTFFIGVPLILAIVFFDFLHHLPANIAITFVSVLAANEFYNLASKKTQLFPRILLIIFSSILPVLSYLFVIWN